MKNNLKIIFTATTGLMISVLPLYANTLLYASEHGDLKLVKETLKNNPKLNIDEQDLNGNTAIIHATHRGDFDIVKYLIDNHANYNIPNSAGNTPLILAAKNGHTKIAQHLIDRGANLNVKNYYGMTALMWALYNNHLDIAGHLINAGANLDLQNNHGDTALMIAVSKNQYNMVQDLIKHGAYLNLKNIDKHTALMWAVSKKYFNIVKYLTDHGADPSITDNVGKTVFNMETSQEIKDFLTQTKEQPNLFPLAIRKFDLREMNHFAKVPQFDDNPYVPNIRSFIKSMQFPNHKDARLITALWAHYKLNPNTKIIKTNTGFKFETQKNIVQKLDDSQFTDVLLITQK